MSTARSAGFRRDGGTSRVSLVITVFTAALALRLIFGRLIADTYDYDEFVLLLLSRDFAHGAVPYRDFMFFHPPGILVLLRSIEPLTTTWWPAARLAMTLVDSVTAVLVCFIGLRVFDRRVGLAAGLVYAASPLALISAVRVGQDPLLTMLGTLSITLLLLPAKARWTVLSGILLAAAIWIKYPAIYFGPVLLLLAPRRFPLVFAVATITLAILFFPFHDQLSALYDQTVTFQHMRWAMAFDQRILTTLLWWIAVNALALPALIRRPPGWIVVGFALGGLFVFTSQVYYHYFVPVVPFAALLAGMTLARVRSWRPPVVIGVMLLCAVLAATILNLGGHSPLYVTAARLSEVQPTVKLLDTVTTHRESVLADRYEYAYLAQRPALAHYFWNIGVLVNAKYLERRVSGARAVVLSSGASSGYPSGFTTYLDRHFPRLVRPTTRVWLIPRSIEHP